MGMRVVFLTILRVILVILSAATLACHIAQIVKLQSNSWVPRHYPYFLYFIGPGISTISSLALLLTTVCSVRSIRGDRFVGLLNLALMIATVVVCTIKSGPVPFTDVEDADVSKPESGFQTCSDYRGDMTLYQRCWLSNGMWIGSIAVAFFWLLLVLFVFTQRSSDIYEDTEYEVYDFKTGGNIPMAVTSPSPIMSPLQQQQQHQHQPSPSLPPSAHPPVVNEYDYGGYYQQQSYGYQQQHQQQPSYADHAYDPYVADPYGGVADPYNNNNGGKGYYVPATPVSTTTTHHTGAGTNDDTAYIMSDIDSHPTSKSRKPHAYD